MNTRRLTLWFVMIAGLLFAPLFSGLAQSGDDEVTPQVEQLYAQAKAAQQRNDSATAIEKYQAMIKLAPHLAAAYNNLGMLYFNQKDYAHAAETLERGLKLHQKMPTASAMLGMSYYQLGENGKAEPLLRAALQANPKDDQAEIALAQVLIRQRKFEDATQMLNDYLGRSYRKTRSARSIRSIRIRLWRTRLPVRWTRACITMTSPSSSTKRRSILLRSNPVRTCTWPMLFG